MPQLNPKIGEIYRHFKGNLYQVRDLAVHSETGRKMVVYQALYGEYTTYVRDFEEFISDVDYEKYPECTLRFRFTLVPEGELKQQTTSTISSTRTLNERTPHSPEIKEVRAEDKVEPSDNNTPKVKTMEQLVMDFLDERDFAEKEKLLSEMRLRDDLTDGVIDNLAAALDVVIDEGPLDKRFSELRTCVSTRARFENTRLRG